MKTQSGIDVNPGFPWVQQLLVFQTFILQVFTEYLRTGHVPGTDRSFDSWSGDCL
jgi:hypothetical protein